MNSRAEYHSTLYRPDSRPAEDQRLSPDGAPESPPSARNSRNSSLFSVAETDKAPGSARSVRSASQRHAMTTIAEKKFAPSPFPAAPALRASKPRFGDYDAIKHHLNFYMALRDKALDTEFHLFNTNKKSGGFIIVSSVLFLCILVPLQVAVIVNDARAHETVSSEALRWRFFFSFASLIFIVLAALSAITLSLRHRGFDAAEKLNAWFSPRNSFSRYNNNNNRNNNNARPRSLYMTLRPAGSWMFGFDLSSARNGVSRSDSELDETPPVVVEQWDAAHRFYYRVNILFALCVQYYFLLMLLRKVFQIDCLNNGDNDFHDNNNGALNTSSNSYDWYVLVNCYEDSALIQVTQSFCIMLITMPAIIKVNLPDTPIGLTWCNLLGSFFVFVVVALYRHVQACIPVALFWMLVCFFTIIDAQTRNMLVFFANKHLTETMRENERMAEENRVEEMRHMLANVAHDLKTPLSSFSMGVDLIYQSMLDFRARLVSQLMSSPDAVCPFYAEHDLAAASRSLAEAVLACVSNIRNTNAFMVMTINRCIDYTKVTKGLRLQPKPETVNLADALQLPLSCMSNIQEKISIGIAPIPSNLSLYVVTDKQWLQENVLCLLSNAVKYSHEGQVVVRLKLEKKEMLKRHGQNSSNKRNSKSIPFNDVLSASSLASARSIRSPDTQTQTYTNTHSHKIVVERTDTLQENTVMEEVEELVLLVEVEDTGIGVPAHMKESLFRPFNQTQKMAGGTGLGLFSLAKRVEALQGDYGVRDRTDNVAGSVFWFAIPYICDEMFAELCISREDSAASQGSQNHNFEQLFEQYGVSSVTAQRQTPSNVKGSLFPAALTTTISKANLLLNMHSNKHEKRFARSRSDSSSSTASAPRVVRPVTTPTPTTTTQTRTNTSTSIAVSSPTNKDVLPSTVRPLHILLVDDTQSILKMSSMMLCRLGHRVTVAENGAAAVMRVCEQFESTREPFDLVLMDLQMPVMDGFEATRRIRSHEEELIKKGLPSFHQRIVGMSANTDEETQQLSLSLGMDFFVGKPLKISTLKEIMQTLD